MTPKEIQTYNRKCAELMGAIGLADTGYRLSAGVYKPYNFHSSWNQQIPVWQKVMKILYSKLYGMDYLPIVYDKAEKIEQDYYEEIRKGTTESAFEILALAIDFVEQFKKENN